ncbi:hypothetical protein JHK85_028318 [Glycine max]|nr:hypothetical protein JHK85_028318 [Glycine max]
MDDLERLKKIRNHHGLRHYWGLRVRGQHTKCTGHRGKTVELVLPSSSVTLTLTTFTTLLINRGKLHESITYNGKAFSNAMKRSRGFVTQDYVLCPT